jgi:hypothetical protein
VRAEVRMGPVEPAGPDLATLDAQALGDELVAAAQADHQEPPRPIRVQRRQLLEGSLRIPGAGGVPVGRRKLLTFEEPDRDQIGVRFAGRR